MLNVHVATGMRGVTDPDRWAEEFLDHQADSGIVDLAEQREWTSGWFAEAIEAGRRPEGPEADYGDEELNAMAIALEAVAPLDEEARRRVLKWVGTRLGFEMEVRGP